MSVRAKVVVVLWFVLALVLVSACVGGWTADDLRGYGAFGLLVAAVPCDAAVVVAALDRGPWFRRSKWVWLLVGLAELAFSYVAFDAGHPDAYRDMEMVLRLTMGILAFPLGIVAPFVLWGAGALVSWLAAGLGLRPPGGTAEFYVAVTGTWAAFVAVGAFQWFVVLPVVLRRLERRKGSLSGSRAS